MRASRRQALVLLWCFPVFDSACASSGAAVIRQYSGGGREIRGGPPLGVDRGRTALDGDVSEAYDPPVLPPVGLRSFTAREDFVRLLPVRIFVRFYTLAQQP